MEEQWITSVGIDLGTSTTKFIVSRLRLGRMSSAFSLPRFQIVERKLVYASPIYSTPLKNKEEIDVEQVSRILREEYEKAQIKQSDIKSGAVIITGETATKRNAQQIVHLLADRSGDFVVATAGADLEGVLAGKGSGAEARSRQIQGVIANIDIGGGTANVAFFHRGKAIGTVTFHVGGRLIRLDQHGLIHYLSPAIQPWLQQNGFHLQEKQTIDYQTLEKITRLLARSMFSWLLGQGEQYHAHLLILGTIPQEIPAIEEVMISGGVGHLMTQPHPHSLAEVAVYGDMGPLLGPVIKAEAQSYPFRLVAAEQTVRATVIGAGMQSTEISGSTVFLKPQLLPLKNIPVLKVEITDRHLSDPAVLQEEINRLMQLGKTLFDPTASPPFAIAMTGISYCSYSALQLIAEELSNAFRAHFPSSGLMVVICENDMAKALGQSLSIRCKDQPQVICIDQVKVEHGDYIDLGEPISHAMIPVIVKTLAFHESSFGVTQ
ncbi:ethanolamine ammonia-lyase reactivating factor EutA [Brevibacillus sp. SYP-B805]|uniref:ethanolamine ammonia-lyase reactivating factor EutA n=1 Tax=Brevibacillus sp. SYP-B805 TaxID=1578199 RepID=UPI0013EC1C52|nr:ethanolamine ammonia-lyase reactivating factor EutA [Brevibacillus sp. SYP-B805]NGQ96933.1 ethanolamine ammonia-lyase reactivating factor EutA [Brevibacillus sp. SYP-B805]